MDEASRQRLLVAAANHKMPYQLEALINSGLNPDAADDDGRTALMQAASRDRSKVMAALVEAGVAVDATDRDGRTALMHAAYDECVGAVKALIEAGADVNARAKDGRTPLFEAVSRLDIRGTYSYEPRTVRMLLEAGADRNIRAKNRKTALSTAKVIRRVATELGEARLAKKATPKKKRSALATKIEAIAADKDIDLNVFKIAFRYGEIVRALKKKD
ncbi:MAG: ankyrin repeat domain-containing protein [Deltaproteobacteria bacterium]|nr:ankyrin repeat domain-containing protein [Deltaproteobacteria bacterium]